MNKNTTLILSSLNVTHRPDGTVHTVRFASNKGTAAEICNGKAVDRLNFKTAPDSALTAQLGIDLGGRSKSWACGIGITDSNAASLAFLLSIVCDDRKQQQGPAPEAPTAA